MLKQKFDVKDYYQLYRTLRHIKEFVALELRYEKNPNIGFAYPHPPQNIHLQP